MGAEFEGVNESAIAEQATEEIVETEESTTNETAEESTEVEGTEEVASAAEVNEPTEQSAEDNARFAAARRQAEAEYRHKTDMLNENVKRMFGNFKNPDTGKPIESAEEYFIAIEAQQRIQREKQLRDKGVDPQMIQDMIANSPIVRNAETINQKWQQEESQRRLEADVKEVSKIDPSIKSLDDLLKSDSYEAVYGYMQNNKLSMVDAYKLANQDKLTASKTAAAKQAAINSAKSTNHLETTRGVAPASTDMVDIPSAALGIWQQAYPDLSVEQLTQKYNAAL